MWAPSDWFSSLRTLMLTSKTFLHKRSQFNQSSTDGDVTLFGCSSESTSLPSSSLPYSFLSPHLTQWVAKWPFSVSQPLISSLQTGVINCFPSPLWRLNGLKFILQLSKPAFYWREGIGTDVIQSSVLSISNKATLLNVKCVPNTKWCLTGWQVMLCYMETP